MQQNLIAAETFCRHHQIELSFLHQLQEVGLAQVVVLHDQFYIDEANLETIEKWRRLHYDLNINFEGLHAIHLLLQRIEGLQEELTELHNRIKAQEPMGQAQDVWPL